MEVLKAAEIFPTELYSDHGGWDDNSEENDLWNPGVLSVIKIKKALKWMIWSKVDEQTVDLIKD